MKIGRTPREARLALVVGGGDWAKFKVWGLAQSGGVCTGGAFAPGGKSGGLAEQLGWSHHGKGGAFAGGFWRGESRAGGAAGGGQAARGHFSGFASCFRKKGGKVCRKKGTTPVTDRIVIWQ